MGDLGHRLRAALGRGPRLKAVRELFDHADCAVAVTSLANAQGEVRFIYVNSAFCRLCGYHPVELIGRSPRLLQGPATDRASLDRVRQAVTERRPTRVELLNYRKDGTTYRVQMAILPIAPRSARGFMLALLEPADQTSVARDNAVASRLFAVLLLTDGDGIFVLDETDRVVLANQVFAQQTGRSEAALRGSAIGDLIEGSEDMTGLFAQVRATSTALRRHVRLRHADGPPVPARLHLAATSQEDGARFVVGRVVLQDGGLTAERASAMQPEAPPGQIEQRLRSQIKEQPPPPSVIAGHLQLVTLAEIKAAMGERWPAAAGKAMTIARQVIERRITAKDVFRQTGDDSFTICFGTLNERAAAFKAQAIVEEIRHRLVGDLGRKESPLVVADTASIEFTEDEIAAEGSLFEAIQRRMENVRESFREGAALSLKQVMAKARLEPHPVMTTGWRIAPIALARFDLATESRLELLARTQAGTGSEFAVDVATLLLSLTTDHIYRNLTRTNLPVLVIPIPFAIFTQKRAMDQLMTLCRSIDAAARPFMIFELADIPLDAAQSRIGDILDSLGVFARAKMIRLPSIDAAFIDFSRYRPAIVALSFQTAEVMANAAKLKDLNTLLHKLRAYRCRILIEGISSLQAASQLSDLGADLLAGSAIDEVAASSFDMASGLVLRRSGGRS